MARFVPGRGFAMVPAWLALKQPSGNAAIVYIHLAMWGRFNQGSARYEDCTPSRQELSTGVAGTAYHGTGLSVATIKRALRELMDLGAIVGKTRYGDDGSQLPTTYEVIYGDVSEPAPPRVTGEPPPGSRVTHLIEEEVLKKEELPLTPTDVGEPAPPATANTTGAQDPVPGPCGRAHDPTAACRGCGTNPRTAAKTAAAAARANRRPCRRHPQQVDGACGLCRADDLAAPDAPTPARRTPAPRTATTRARLCARCRTMRPTDALDAPCPTCHPAAVASR